MMAAAVERHIDRVSEGSHRASLPWFARRAHQTAIGWHLAPSLYWPTDHVAQCTIADTAHAPTRRRVGTCADVIARVMGITEGSVSQPAHASWIPHARFIRCYSSCVQAIGSKPPRLAMRDSAGSGGGCNALVTGRAMERRAEWLPFRFFVAVRPCHLTIWSVRVLSPPSRNRMPQHRLAREGVAGVGPR